MDRVNLVERLRWLVEDARSLGLSDADLASVGVGSAQLEAVAAGDLGSWTTFTATQLARRLGYDDGVLWREEGPTVQELRGYRGTARVLAATDQVLLRGVQSVLEALEIRPTDTTRTTPKRSARRPPWSQGYALARWARKLGHVEKVPLPDLASWIEATFSVPVLTAPLATTQLEGVTVLGPRGVALVLDRARVGDALPMRRTMAHELCHALFDPLPSEPAWRPEFGGDPAGDEELLEQRARAFAAELLIPLAGLRRLELPAEPQARVGVVAEHFGAPTELTRFHLDNHGFLGEPDSARAAVELPTMGSSWTAPPGQLLWRTLGQRIEAGEMSLGRARELARLLVSVDGARELLAA